ncbi:MAG: [protein-PII] uridylyltransferase [Alphaproteobacteria bacterium]|nr:[protein-PII] uridylyltransferase [Alphaproteobacteria bacterium]
MDSPARALTEPDPAPIDGVALRQELTAAARTAHGTDALRRVAVDILKQAMAEGRERSREVLRQRRSGLAAARLLSRVMDEVIAALYDFTVKHVYYAQNPSTSERIAVVAVGGYGRGALAPGSDIDLLFLLPWKQTAWGESVVEFMLYTLWDLRLKVGHATRNVDECIRLSKADMTIRTSILEARFLWGEASLCEQMKSRFDKEIAAQGGQDFVDAKLAERDERHRRSGESRYLVEPNVKDGKGGLRDLNTLFWIAKYLYRVEDVAELIGRGVFTAEELATFARAEEFLWTVRCHLHFLTGRPEERLSFDVQRDMSALMGYGSDGNAAIEAFMKDYFLTAKDVGDLTRIFCAVLEDQNRKRAPGFGKLLGFGPRKQAVAPGFFIEGGRLCAEDGVFPRDPVNLLRLFALADQKAVHIHPNALKAATRSLNLIDDALRADPEANRLFLSVLSSKRDPETVLRWMNECGVFGRFVPAFGRIVALMQFNMYHHFTVDEHLLRAIGSVSQIERGLLKADHPLAAQIFPKIKHREALYVAMLLHDIAKGTERDHSEEGEEIAQELGPRLGLSAEETEIAAWLVRHHLLMSDVAQKRDLADPKTIDDFVKIVQTPERLRLLLVLTVADIRAVGPGVFNGWKGQLLRDLYAAAEEQMLGGRIEVSQNARVRSARDGLAGRLSDWTQADRDHALFRHYASYWLTLPADMHERHARFMREADASGDVLSLDARADPFRAVTEITIYTGDHPGLFQRLAGGFAVAGASVVDAKVFTTTDGMALDVFWVQDDEGHAFDLSRLDRVKAALLRTLKGEVLARAQIDARKVKKRDEAFAVTPQVIFDNDASNVCTVIEVDARDRPGLLHDLTRALYQAQLSIHSAVIATYGEQAVDVFYVKDLFGLKLDHRDKMAGVERKLLEAMGGGGARPERPQRAKA